MSRPILASVSLALFAVGCISSAPPTPLRLRRVVLYRNGVGYFEQSGRHDLGSLTLRLRRREIDDVLGTLTVVEDGARGSSIAAVLPRQAHETGESDSLVGVDVRLGAARRRNVTIGYAVPTPTWMAGYRVVLPRGRGPGQALLQAWAMVHNASGDDWHDVALTLASGGPLSFAMDMRTPHFVDRPDVTAALGAPAVYGAVRSERSQARGDTDHDAIADVEDRCPDEPEVYNGTEDADGCPDRGMVVISENRLEILENIHFAVGSRALSERVAPILEAIAVTLRANPHIRRVELRGHAADDEPDVWSLAAARAAAVRAALIERGVEAARLDAIPLGDTQPVDPRRNAQARERNRRVELHVTDTDGSPDAPATGAITIASLERTHRAAAAALTVADGTRYELVDAVDIPSGTSTLVSILQRRIGAEDVLLYRPDGNVPESDAHPFRAARLENDAGVDLVGGPVALFADGSFVGQGLMDDLHTREEGFVPYAVDRATTVAVTTSEDQAPLRMLSLVRGTMTVLDASVLRTTYTIAPGARVPERIFVRHATRAGYAPVTLPPGSMPTPDAWLVPVRVDGVRQTVLTIEERRPTTRTLAIADDGPTTELRVYVSGSGLDATVARRLSELVDLRDRLGLASEDEANVRGQLADEAARAEELRESLRATDRAGGAAASLRRELMTELARSTSGQADLGRRLAALRATTLELRLHLQDAARNLRVDPAATP